MPFDVSTIEANTREVDEKYRELEARVRELSEKCQETEARLAEETAQRLKTEELYFEQLSVAEAEEKKRLEAEERCRTAETRLAQETELRILAEQQVKILAESLNVNLDLGWSGPEAEIAKAGASLGQSVGSAEEYQQLLAELEVERRSRLIAEQARDDAETEAHEIQKQLLEAEEKRRHSEAHYETLIDQLQSDLHKMSSKTTPDARSAKSHFSAATERKPDEPLAVQDKRQATNKMRGTLGMIAVLLFILVLLCIAAYREL